MTEMLLMNNQSNISLQYKKYCTVQFILCCLIHSWVLQIHQCTGRTFEDFRVSLWNVKGGQLAFVRSIICFSYSVFLLKRPLVAIMLTCARFIFGTDFSNFLNVQKKHYFCLER